MGADSFAGKSVLKNLERRPHAPGSDAHIVQFFDVTSIARPRLFPQHLNEMETQNFASRFSKRVIRKDARAFKLQLF
jgi:hypothetical protein